MISVIGMQTRPGHTPVPIAAREASDTPTMLRVSIEERRVLEDNRAGLEDRLRERARKEAEQKVAASNKRLNRQDVLRLVVEEGIGASEAARRLGVTRETIANHLRRGVEYGEIVRVGRGKYAWADGKEAQTDVSEDRVREEIEKALDVAHENVSTMVEDLAHQIAEQGRKLSELAETVVKLQRDVSALDIDVQELQRSQRDMSPDLHVTDPERLEGVVMTDKPMTDSEAVTAGAIRQSVDGTKRCPRCGAPLEGRNPFLPSYGRYECGSYDRDDTATVECYRRQLAQAQAEIERLRRERGADVGRAARGAWVR